MKWRALGIGLIVLCRSVCASDLSVLIRNESEAIRVLRLLAAEQNRFCTAGAVDQDKNGRGEYGLICELTGETPYRGGGGKRWQPAFIKMNLPTRGAEGQGFASHSGYRFRVFLGVPESAQGDDRTIAGRTVKDRLTVHAQEMEFNLYAWPEVGGETGRFAFHVDSLASAGILFYTDMSGRRYSGAEGPGPFAILRPPASPPHVLRTIGRDEKSGDGNVWYPALERIASLRSLLAPGTKSEGLAAPIKIDFRSQSDGPWTLHQVDDSRLSSEVTAVGVGAGRATGPRATGPKVWIGIPGGASVFDGNAWQSFALERGDGDTIIRRIISDRGNSLWFVGRWDIVALDGMTWRVVEGDFPASPILAAAVLDKGPCFAFAKHLAFFRDGVPTMLDVRERFFDCDIESLCADKNGDIYIGTHERVLRFDGREFKTYTTADGLPAGTYVYWLEFDTHGTLWAATYAGLFRRDDETWRRVAEGGNVDRPKKVERILCDTHGGIWVFADGRLSRFANGKWRFFDHPFVRTLGEVTGMAEGEDGGVYFSGKGGLLRYAPSHQE